MDVKEDNEKGQGVVRTNEFELIKHVLTNQMIIAGMLRALSLGLSGKDRKLFDLIYEQFQDNHKKWRKQQQASEMVDNLRKEK